MEKPGAGSKRTLIMIGAGVAAVIVVVILVVFQPQKLFIDDTVSEPVPGLEEGAADETGATDDDGKSTPRGLEELAAGTFVPLAHDAGGRALILETAAGTNYLRFEDFEVENGPDLRVYLSKASDDGSYDADFVDLGALKGNIGDQNYEIPTGTDLDTYVNAVVWCRAFSVGFAVAELR